MKETEQNQFEKPWYEDANTIDKLVVVLKTGEKLKALGFNSITRQMKVGFNDAISYYESIENLRPATKEECLSLYKEIEE